MIQENLRVAVLCGGFGNEREVSLRSGSNVARHLIEAGVQVALWDPAEKPLANLVGSFDAVYNILHGSFGEDGHAQGALAALGLPFTGESLLVSAVCFHKVRTKEILKAHHLPTSPWLDFSAFPEATPEHLVQALQDAGLAGPWVLKPAESGSSVGVQIARSELELLAALYKLRSPMGWSGYFAEDFVGGREMTVGLYRDQGRRVVLPVLELKPKSADFYDFQAKYTSGATQMILPAPLTQAEQATLQDLAVRLDRIFHFQGGVRFDVILGSNGFRILEINTQPGMTATSDIPAMLGAAGIPIRDFLFANLENAVKNKKSFGNAG